MWVNTKIDWDSNSYYNFEDYNRLRNNMLFLQELSSQLYLHIEYGILSNNYTIEVYPRANDFNVIESNLFLLINNCNLGVTFIPKIYYENGKFLSADDFNRVERAMKQVYDLLISQQNNRLRLAFNTLPARKVG